MTIPFHPLANIFPLMSAARLAELVADIKARGQQEPITLYEGKVLEGRNRVLACKAAGVEPVTKVFEGTDPAAFVWSANFLRRHLNKSQRAIAVSKYATLNRGDAARKKSLNPEIDGYVLSQEEAAKLADVSIPMIQRAKLVLKNGTPTEIADVQEGKAKVDKVAKVIRERQGLPPGTRARMPKGYDRLSDAVWPGLELERGGAVTIKAAKKADMSLQTYVTVRDIVLLSQRNDLPDRDMKTVHIALKELDETRRVKHPRELIRPISMKVWGRNGNRYRSDKTRVAAFNESIIFVVSGCTAIADCDIPVLEKKRRTEATKELSRAISALSKLRRRLRKEEGYGSNY